MLDLDPPVNVFDFLRMVKIESKLHTEVPQKSERYIKQVFHLETTFIPGSRPGASRSQTLAANPDVELNQSACRGQQKLNSKSLQLQHSS